jgi:hypothetical protein
MFWQARVETIRVEVHVFTDQITTRIRRSLEAELIRSRRPHFNIAGASFKPNDNETQT